MQRRLTIGYDSTYMAIFSSRFGLPVVSQSDFRPWGINLSEMIVALLRGIRWKVPAIRYFRTNYYAKLRLYSRFLLWLN